jgi:hypothetical protein
LNLALQSLLKEFTKDIVQYETHTNSIYVDYQTWPYCGDYSYVALRHRVVQRIDRWDWRFFQHFIRGVVVGFRNYKRQSPGAGFLLSLVFSQNVVFLHDVGSAYHQIQFQRRIDY